VETNPVNQESAPAPPPSRSGAPALPQAPNSAFPSSILPVPGWPLRTDRVADQPGKSATTKLTFAPGRLTTAIGPCLAESLEQRWTSYRKELRRCQEEFSEDAVHELRVASRRLLAQFVLLSSVAPSTGLEKARSSLKRRIVALGDLRDTQVQLTFIDQHAGSFPELDPLRAWLRHREDRLVKSAAKKVNRFRTKKFGKWISAMTEDLTASAGNVRARKQLASALAHTAANAFAEVEKRRQAIDLADLGTIHQTRVAFKRFRYIMETLSPCVTGLTKRQLRTLAYYQRRMGIIQDLEVMKRCVERFVAEHKNTESALHPFRRYLRQRRTRALRSFLKSADRVFEFWPTARLAAPSRLSRTLNAA
jgi:CHAD domain-containing protein